MTPTLFINTSRRGTFSITSRPSRRTSSIDDRSALIVVAWPHPSLMTCSLISTSFLSSRPTRTRPAPILASPMEVALPMPPVAPVTLMAPEKVAELA